MFKNPHLLRKMIVIAALAMISHSAFAQTWTDVTAAYLDNPDFSNGSTNGWAVTVTDYQNCGYQGATYSNNGSTISGFLEVWTPSPNVLGAGDVRTSVTLPKGSYRLEVDAIATRQSSYGNAAAQASNVYLFAKTASGRQFSKEIKTNDGAPQHFTIDFSTDSYGGVNMGMLLQQGHNANWVALDNAVLKISGSVVPLIGMNLSDNDLSLEVGKSKQITVTYLPDNATFQKCTWTTSNPSVATVSSDGTVTATGKGTATITARSYDGAVTATCKVTVTRATVPSDALIINEIQSSNIDIYMDPSYNYGGWIELYNQTAAPVTLAGLYITDDATNLKKHKLYATLGSVPAKGYKTIWFDHNGIWNKGELEQVSFKLDCEGGTIIISDGEEIISEQDYPEAVSRVSYARKTDGAEEWGLSDTPTPGATNNSMLFARTQLAEPVIDTPSGFNVKSFSVAIPSGCTLRYTIDGSTPTKTNGSTNTTGTFTVTGSKVYRFRLFKDGYLASNVVTRSFLTGSYKLPVISLATKRDNIYNTSTGLFQSGSSTKGRPGNGQDGNCNWNMDWDRPVNFDYFVPDESGQQKIAFSQEVDMSMCGGWSRAWSPHSFKLKAGKQYQGLNSLNYQFFPGKSYLKHKTLQIRNGGNDTNCRIKDGALQEIVNRSGLYVDGQSFQPVEVFINGTFYAVLNMREPNNKHFASANYGIDTDYMDQFEMSPDSGYVQMEGTKDAYTKLVKLSANAADEATYKEIGKLLDIDEYINYMAVEFYLANWDWPQNNVKGFRDQDNGKFHFVLFDLDGSFSNDSSPFSGFNGKENYTFDAWRGQDGLGNSLWGQRKTEQIEFVTLFKNLLKNTTFRKKFVDAFCLVGGSVFEPTRSKTIINEINSMLTSAGVSSSNTANTLINTLTASRQNTMTTKLKNDAYDFGVGSKTSQKLTLKSNVEGADVLFNGMPVPTGKFTGQVFSPVTLTAVAPAGYEFAGWKSSSNLTYGSEATLFSKGSTWYYYDKGGFGSTVTWRQISYSETWPQGKTPIGYGKSTIATKTASNLLTYYFRKFVMLDEAPSSSDVFTLNYTIDDGMIIYVNGTEAGRYNMPSGRVTSSTAASTYANNNPDTGTLTLPANLFVKGSNLIAVEVHNNQTSSSDIMWDAELIQTKYKVSENEYITTNNDYTIPSSGNIEVTAVYKAVEDNTCPVKINEISADNSMYVNDYFKKDDWVELYNTSSEDVDVNGWYLSDNLSKPKKYQISNEGGQNTVVPAKGHLVLWASKRDPIGDMIHLSFKLGNDDGELLLLTSADETWTDTLTYVAQTSQESVGLFPDGGNNVYYFSMPSISKHNFITSYARQLYTKQPSPRADDDAVEEIVAGEQRILNNVKYNLSGQRITEVKRGEIYIMNGRKYLRK